MDRDSDLLATCHLEIVRENDATVRLEIHVCAASSRIQLAVIHCVGTPAVWDELLDSDDQGDAFFRSMIDDEGIENFLSRDNGFPFPGRS